MNVKKRLEHLRSELNAERISYVGLMELQTLAEQGEIDPSDTQLLEAAGVPESDYKNGTYAQRYNLRQQQAES